MKPSVSFRTFGCRLNQLETEALAGAFAAAGFETVAPNQGADVAVLNTCTVTGKAEQKARRELRAALARNPEGLVLVTGCYAELESAALAALFPRTLVVPGSDKDRVLALPGRLAEAIEHGLDPVDEARLALSGASAQAHDPFAFRPESFAFHARAALKIEDGCDNACTYCRVRLARGRAVSLPLPEVLARARALEASGAAELVLTGVNLSQYRDPLSGAGFAALLEALVAGTERVAYRVSSWEPDRVDAAFARALGLDRVRAHVHLALQSGCDATLGRMARPYRAAQVRAAVASLRQAKPGLFLGADLIVGFPGESDAEFEATLALLDELRPAWVHAFVYSPRPGTRAYDMGGRVPERVAGERAGIVAQRAALWRADYARSRLGQETTVVLEHPGEGEGAEEAPRFTPRGPEPAPLAAAASRIAAGGLDAQARERRQGAGSRSGVSDEFLRVLVHGLPADCDRVGAQVRVRLDSLLPGGEGLGRPDLEATWLGPC